MLTGLHARIKQTIVIILSLIMFMTAFAALPILDNNKVYGAGKTAQVTANLLNVRSGAGTNYSKIGSLSKGKTFTVIGSAKDSSGVTWYKFKYGDKTGYVSSKHVNIKQSTVTSVSNLQGTVNTQTDPLTVRSGPGSSYSKLGTLAKGKTFKITGKAKDKSGVVWYKLTYSGKTGYVSSAYVKVTYKTEEEKPADPSDAGNKDEESGDDKNESVTFKMGTTTAVEGLNVRTGPGSNYSRLTLLPYKTAVVIIGSAKASNGKIWYKYQYSSTKIGYICSDYVKVQTVTSDSEFEKYLNSQRFPESYKPGLRLLHKSHPKWLFKANRVGFKWSTALSAESVVGRNLISSSAPVSYRSTAKGSYNPSTKRWTTFDGGWYAANEKVIAYYMDPRNFLNESGIYQFMTHKYDSKSQNANTVAAVINGSFMQKRNPGGGYSSYSTLIDAAGKATGVNPNVLAAMIIQEQGWNGSSLVSGNYPGYKGYYNFFNIGAYTAGGMNAVQRGLWYASRSGSYSRPWNTPYKSIKGGAKFYSENYVSNNQDSYYTKKFNVNNGSSNVGYHQYMTNVAAAASEGSLVKRAYSNNDNYPVIFNIPVYNSMPSSACKLP